MKHTLWFTFLLANLWAGVPLGGFSQTVGVTLSLDTNVVSVGGTTTLHVKAQILPAFRSGSDRIFSWYVDVLNTNGTAASANYGAMQKTASDNDPLISSNGTADAANRRGIFDTFLNLPGAGRDSPVELMAIPVTGVAVGATRFRIQAGTGVGLTEDFLVAPAGGGDPLMGGDYSAAFVDLNVVNTGIPKPVLSITPTNTGGHTEFILRYAVQPGFDYYVEHRDGLGNSAGWQIFPGGPYNSGIYVDIDPPSPRFYRVLVVPRGFLSSFRVDIQPTATPGQLRLLFPVMTGFNYTVEYRDALAMGTWQSLPGGPHNSGNIIVNAGNPTRFFRVRAN